MNLNCADGLAHVEWVASLPGCQYDCKAYWTCDNANGIPYHEEVGMVNLMQKHL